MKSKKYSHFLVLQSMARMLRKLKKSLGKSIRFERGVPELSENLCEINARYNNIIILDDFIAEVTDSPVVSRPTVYTRPPSKRQCYLIAAKHVS